MKSRILLIVALFASAFVFAQTRKEEPSLENFRRKYRYVKDKNYKGPDNYYNSPAEMGDGDENIPQSNSSSGSNGGTIQYSPDEIDRIRDRKAQRSQSGPGGSGDGFGQGGGGGTKPRDPEMGKPEPIEFDPPDIDPPDVDIPDVNAPTFSASLVKTILIILAAIALLLIVYYIVKNYRPRNKRVKTEFVQEEWNPGTVSKSELELRLEQAMAENNYRECVRIYFTFILKEMIRLRLIRWKKELTNFDYLLQAQASPNYREFEESVRIYDLVWYGDYSIGKEDYLRLENHLDRHYKLLSAQHA